MYQKNIKLIINETSKRVHFSLDIVNVMVLTKDPLVVKEDKEMQ